MATATFSWLDHREDDAQRVREALKALDEPGMLDPLGFGVIRDAFSEMLFPGISTVQTRARYLLLVPWVYQRLEAEKVASSESAAVARAWELDLIDALCEGSSDRAGARPRSGPRSTRRSGHSCSPPPRPAKRASTSTRTATPSSTGTSQPTLLISNSAKAECTGSLAMPCAGTSPPATGSRAGPSTETRGKRCSGRPKATGRPAKARSAPGGCTRSTMAA